MADTEEVIEKGELENTKVRGEDIIETEMF